MFIILIFQNTNILNLWIALGLGYTENKFSTEPLAQYTIEKNSFRYGK